MGEIAMNLLHETATKMSYELDIWNNMGPQSFFIYIKEKINFLIQRKNKNNDYSFVIEAVEEGQ